MPPAVTVAVPSVLAMARSATTAAAWIPVTLLEESLSGLTSLVFATVAVLVTLGTAASVGLTVTEMSGRLAPEARPPAGVTVQVTVEPAVPQAQPEPAADTRFSPAGTVSVTVITPAMFAAPHVPDGQRVDAVHAHREVADVRLRDRQVRRALGNDDQRPDDVLAREVRPEVQALLVAEAGGGVVAVGSDGRRRRVEAGVAESGAGGGSLPGRTEPTVPTVAPLLVW